MQRFKKTESYKIKQAIFVFIVALVLLAVFLVLTQRTLLAQIVFIVGVAALLLFLVRQYDFLLTLKEYERAVIYQFGRVNRVGGPGWALVIPLIETFKIVDLRTQTLDVPAQNVITKDNVVAKVDAVIYLYVNKDKQSITNSVIEIDNYKHGAELFVQASIRSVAGSLTLTELISNIAKLNEEVKKNLAQITASWGVSVESVEITDISVPPEVQDAMSAKAAAEQTKLARMESAQAHKAEIEAVREAAESLSDKALGYYYVKALEKIGESQSTKLVLPMELTALVASIARAARHASKEDLEGVFKDYAPLVKAYVHEKPGKAKRLPA
ncbi:MAG: SPFH domain-containing protein [Candidatus Diapherotrites archaeon]|nr:SPFH domain-containing protein [Candidatus Diapherotrites archaeon]